MKKTFKYLSLLLPFHLKIISEKFAAKAVQNECLLTNRTSESKFLILCLFLSFIVIRRYLIILWMTQPAIIILLKLAIWVLSEISSCDGENFKHEVSFLAIISTKKNMLQLGN